MKTDTIDFLEALLFNTDEESQLRGGPLYGKTVYDFTPAFTEAAEKFIDAFRAHLESTGFPVDKLDNCERSFGGDVYWSLSGAGVGFFDDNDPEIAGVQAILKAWAGAYRFEDLAGMLDANEDGEIDLAFIPEALEEYREKYFGVPSQGHTPGPWSTGCCLTTVEVRPAGWKVPMVIADCHVSRGYPPKSSAERVANARLIAAAPELLPALQSLLIVADHPDNPMRAGANASIIEQAREAIAKAKESSHD